MTTGSPRWAQLSAEREKARRQPSDYGSLRRLPVLLLAEPSDCRRRPPVFNNFCQQAERGKDRRQPSKYGGLRWLTVLLLAEPKPVEASGGHDETLGGMLAAVAGRRPARPYALRAYYCPKQTFATAHQRTVLLPLIHGLARVPRYTTELVRIVRMHGFHRLCKWVGHLGQGPEYDSGGIRVESTNRLLVRPLKRIHNKSENVNDLQIRRTTLVISVVVSQPDLLDDDDKFRVEDASTLYLSDSGSKFRQTFVGCVYSFPAQELQRLPRFSEIFIVPRKTPDGWLSPYQASGSYHTPKSTRPGGPGLCSFEPDTLRGILDSGLPNESGIKNDQVFMRRAHRLLRLLAALLKILPEKLQGTAGVRIWSGWYFVISNNGIVARGQEISVRNMNIWHAKLWTGRTEGDTPFVRHPNLDV
ncbi:hypothetical protein B0H14DRAFT_3150035 [Mycena olivaceomarginata]|nr:hypothetical protein B0H14DRAFT_3150035 [Mycena olivaceomarginata]